MNESAPVFDAEQLSLHAAGICLTDLAPLIDGVAPNTLPPITVATGDGWTVGWSLADGSDTCFVLAIRPMSGGTAVGLDLTLDGTGAERPLDSIGISIGRAGNVRRYLRNGYSSWDGSYFVQPDSACALAESDPDSLSGHAVTALISDTGRTAVLGFLRHDRFQSRLRFAFSVGAFALAVETLIDRTNLAGPVVSETLVLLAGSETEETMRSWARHVAAASPLEPRVESRRISGWSSWYSLYSSISDPIIVEHLAAAARFRDRHRVPFEVFQIDDGFTPEMGDWLTVRPTFPRGMQPLLADIRAAGFTPGLWIAPFMIGNRSRLYAEHPEWVVRQRRSDRPIVPMKFYGEFRWHKRSEEYYVLDITHPEAEAYIRKVFRTWRQDWGCEYFKTDFMYFGSEYGPDQARWHTPGLSRIEIWMRMARLIRAEIGDARWLTCGSPIWAGVGLVDAARIGRDVGVSWAGERSAQSLLRDQTARNFANGILWQSDPDCVLLRERFHDLTDEQVRSLALFAGLAGGVLMTSDQLDEAPAERRELFAGLLGNGQVRPCDFPMLGHDGLRHSLGTGPEGEPTLCTEGDPVLLQRVRQPDATVIIALFNTSDTVVDRQVDWAVIGFGPDAQVQPLDPAARCTVTEAGIRVTLPPYATHVLRLAGN